MVLGYYSQVTYKVQKQHEKTDKKVVPKVNRLISRDLQMQNLKKEETDTLKKAKLWCGMQ